jgi:N-acetyltransferase
MFDLQPVLTGKLLKLRPMQPDDFAPLFAAASDPEIWAQHPSSDRWKQEVFKGYFDSGLASGGALVILDAQTGEIIGSSRFYGFDESASEIEIGWTFLATRYWGGLYNRELKDLMLGHAFKYVDHVLFYVGPHNKRSRRAVEKLGAVLIGERERFGGKHVVYRLSKNALTPSAF